MLRRPPGSTRPDTLFPSTTLFRSVARIGDGIGRRRALDDEQPLADDRHIERLFARFIAALREFLGDAVEARPLSRDHPRRLVGRRGEDVAELPAAADRKSVV